MAKRTPSGGTPQPLHSAAGRAWLAAELAAAERAVRTGPGGMGWQFNEALRPAIEERAAFLQALTALLPNQP